jgi:hypothetical protein
MAAIQRAVVIALLAVWCFPAVSAAKTTEPTGPAPLPALVTETAARTPAAARTTSALEAAQLAAREKQAQDLQNFKGGEGVYIYMGSGVLLVAVIILLLVLI